MSSLALPPTLDVRLRAIRKGRRASRVAEVVHLGAWFVGIAGAVSVAGATRIGNR